MKTFKTPKGTEIPIIELQGKPYLQVAWRILWFREVHSGGSITTERISESEKHVTYRAFIKTENDKLLASADKTLNIVKPTDYEKCETGAIGRALALAGFGTQFASEDLEEGEHLADAPLKLTDDQGNLGNGNREPMTFDVGKHKGKTFQEVLDQDTTYNYAFWVKNQCEINAAKTHPTLKEFMEYCKIQGVYDEKQ